jgi:lipopolysaccharide biosynthesis glycosyltransferase
MFYYFYAGMFLPKDIIKILYLDIDTIILGDLSEAYEQQLPFMFTGVRDFVISYYIR